MIARTTLIISGSLAFVGQLGHDERNMMLMPTQESVYSLSFLIFFSAGITYVGQKFGLLCYSKLQSIQHYPSIILQSSVWNGSSGTRHKQSPFKLINGRFPSRKHINPHWQKPFQSDQLSIPSYFS